MILKLDVKNDYRLFRDSVKIFFKDNMWRDIFFFSFVAGVIIHFVILANCYVNHDSVVLTTNSYDWLLAQGKWFVTPIHSLEGTYDISYLSTLIGVAFFSISAVVFCEMFKIKKRWYARLVGICMVSFPSVATMALYHAADYFSIAFCGAITGGYLISRSGIIVNFIGIILVTLSIGAYQPFIGAALIVLILDCMLRALLNEEVHAIIVRGGRYLFNVAIAGVGYYVILQCFLKIFKISLSAYRGVNDISSNLAPNVLITSIRTAYADFFAFIFMGKLSIYGQYIVYQNILIAVLTIILLVIVYKDESALKPANKWLTIFLFFVCLPIAANAVGVIAANKSFYYISIMQFVLIFTVPIVLVSQLPFLQESKGRSISKGFYKFKIQWLIRIIMVMILLNCLLWAKQDNIVYHKIMLINREYDAKIPTLIARIQNTKNYTEDTKFIIIGKPPYSFLDSSGILKTFELNVDTRGFGFLGAKEEVYAEGVLWAMINHRYSVELKHGKFEDILDTDKDKVYGMPVYPAEGSIQMINGNVVVKLSNCIDK